MAMDTYYSNELLDIVIYETISASPYLYDSATTCNYQNEYNIQDEKIIKADADADADAAANSSLMNVTDDHDQLPKEECRLTVEGLKKRPRRRAKKKLGEGDDEAQRMAHIIMERNRRKQMNHHLSMLSSLMPHSYLQRGDQASIVGGAIDFIKELEHNVQTLEAQKFVQLQQTGAKFDPIESTPFAQFTFPQTPSKHYTCCKTNGAIADVEVTLIETHANIRILSRQRLRQLSHLIYGFQAVYLTILHFNVTTLEPMVLYSISCKVEEGCLLKSSDDIAGAIHQMLRIIEEGEDGLA